MGGRGRFREDLCQCLIFVSFEGSSEEIAKLLHTSVGSRDQDCSVDHVDGILKCFFLEVRYKEVNFM